MPDPDGVIQARDLADTIVDGRVLGDIQSDNFTHGFFNASTVATTGATTGAGPQGSSTGAGWQILMNGRAEFNDLLVRGTIAASVITGSQIFGTVITGNTINAGTVNAATITGGTISAAAISAGSITGSTITAVSISATTITGGLITAATITAGSISGSTITAGTFQTGTTGARVVLSDAAASRVALHTGDTGEQRPGIIFGSVSGSGATRQLAMTINAPRFDSTGAQPLIQLKSESDNGTVLPSMRFLTSFGNSRVTFEDHIDIDGMFTFPTYGSAPSTMAGAPVEGSAYVDTVANTFNIWTGSSWHQIGSSW